ncbi:uncharacterized protein UTRI_06573_B [Ustilago trichophora]|uniref:SH3 domain-containing protein n=1 Tax=Ustilago trichophora TaxID=86804 RepID=A0A5C3EQJ7_9BASI|nr:uncharacterized protein UTRI_06573_B [Ustilago trichophora]
MPSIEARLKSANADADGVPTRTDRKSADAVFLSTSNLTPELSRVNSTPLSSEAIDALSLQPSISSSGHDSLNDPSPLTMAPPKPGPADTLYPSPSGGFVPSPEEGQDWRLKPPPPGRSANQAASTSSAANPATASTSSPSAPSRALSPVAEANQRPISCLSPTAASSTSTPTRPPSLPSSHETAAKIASAASNSLSKRSSQASNSVTSPQLRPSSSSPSSRHRLSTASSLGSGLAGSQTLTSTAEFESSPADCSSRDSAALQNNDSSSQPSAKSTRPNSTASYQTARIGDDKEDHNSVFWIKVRDFAYPSDDPRHHGQQLLEEQANSGEQDADEEEGQEPDEFYIEGAEDDEFDGDEGDNANIPQGIYNVLYEFDPVSEHELAVQPGEVVHVVGSLEGGWAIAIKNDDQGIKGLVPATYLKWSGPLPE